jgi:putative transposase
MMKRLQADYPIPLMSRVFGVSKSGYYAWHKREPSKRVLEEARLAVEIKAAHARTRQTYGPERLREDLLDHGIKTTVYRVRRMRQALGIRCLQKRKFKATTDSRHRLPVAPNRLQQSFSATAPNQVWLSDITAIATKEGWLYLAAHKDLFTLVWWPPSPARASATAIPPWKAFGDPSSVHWYTTGHSNHGMKPNRR